MSIPDFFYTDIKGEERCYSKNPPGNFSVGQALKQRPPWDRVKSETKRVQKSIVFAEWTFEAWSAQKREMASQKILQLMKEGFSFYLWEYEELTPLNEKKFLQMCRNDEHLATQLADTAGR